MSEAIVIIAPPTTEGPVRIEVKYPNELPPKVAGPLSIGDDLTRIKFESAAGTSKLSMTSSIDPEEGGDPVISGFSIEAITNSPGAANVDFNLADQQVVRFREVSNPESTDPHVRFYRPVRGIPAQQGNQFVVLDQVSIPFSEVKVLFLTPDQTVYTFAHNLPVPYAVALQPLTADSAVKYWVSEKRDNEFDVTFDVAPSGSPLIYDVTVTPIKNPN